MATLREIFEVPEDSEDARLWPRYIEPSAPAPSQPPRAPRRRKVIVLVKVVRKRFENGRQVDEILEVPEDSDDAKHWPRYVEEAGPEAQGGGADLQNAMQVDPGSASRPASPVREHAPLAGPSREKKVVRNGKGKKALAPRVNESVEPEEGQGMDVGKEAGMQKGEKSRGKRRRL